MSRDFRDRVDDGILAAAGNLARLRDLPLRGGLRDVRASAVENAELSRGLDDEEIWKIRVDRCDALLVYEDEALRRRARDAREFA